MRMWLVGQRVIPVGLLFMDGPKMECPGYRWAPKDVWRQTINDGDAAKCVPAPGKKGKAHKSNQPKGSLQFKKPGLILSTPLKLPVPTQRMSDSLYIRDRDSKARFRVDWSPIDKAEGVPRASQSQFANEQRY